MKSSDASLMASGPAPPRSEIPARWPVLLALTAGVLGAAAALRGAPPPLDFLFPAGGAIGSNLTVTAGGKFEAWPVSVWTDAPELVFEPGQDKGTFQVKLDPGLDPGPHLVRLFNEQGASSPRLFLAGSLREMPEIEPNNALDQAQRVEALPVTINGRLEKGEDVDSYAVHLEAGHWLIAAVDAYRLDSPIDPLLHLLDSNGTRIDFNHDERTLDPRLAHKIDRSGTYVVRISAFAYPPQANIRLAGEASAIYRLTLCNGPYPTHTYPAGVQRGQKATVGIYGWNLETSNRTLSVTLDASVLAGRQASLPVSCPQGEHWIDVPVGEHPECLENEPNDTSAQAQRVSVPSTINGRIAPGGDEDRFQFPARQGETYTVGVCGGALGFPLDAVLRIEDAQGKQLARDDDGGTGLDAELTWKAGEPGDYVVVVSDLLGQGGADWIYRLELARAEPRIEISVGESPLVLTPGKTAELSVTANRLHGETNAWILDASGLPEGVTVEEAKIPLKGGKTTLRFAAKEEAKPFGGLIEILAVTGEADHRETRRVKAKLKGKYAEAGDLLLNEVDRLWLTVPPQAPTEVGKPSQGPPTMANHTGAERDGGSAIK